MATLARKVSPRQSVGNVFRDLGLLKRSESLRVRSILIAVIINPTRRPLLSRRAAAAFFGVTQPRVGNLVRGRIELFGIDTVAHAGTVVRVSFRRTRSGTRIAWDPVKRCQDKVS